MYMHCTASFDLDTNHDTEYTAIQRFTSELFTDAQKVRCSLQCDALFSFADAPQFTPTLSIYFIRL